MTNFGRRSNLSTERTLTDPVFWQAFLAMPQADRGIVVYTITTYWFRKPWPFADDWLS